MRIGERLRMARQACGLSQKAVGEALGHVGLTVLRWERDDRLPKDNEDFRRLTEIYQVSEQWLLTGKGVQPEASDERRAQARVALLCAQQGKSSRMDLIPQKRAHTILGHGDMDLRIRDRAFEVSPALLQGAVGEQRIALHEYYLRIRTVFDTRQVEASRLGIHPEVLNAIAEGVVLPSATLLPRFLRVTGAPPDWLLTGKRDPLQGGDE